MNYVIKKNGIELKNCIKKVRSVRLLFQDYAPIPAQKRLLAKKTGEEVWSNVRPPLISMTKEKGDELAEELNNNFGYSF